MHHENERALVACSVWLRMGFIFGSVAAGGLLALVGGDADGLSAAALAFLGGVLAAASWRHARTLLGDSEGVSTVAGIALREQASRASSKPSGRSTMNIAPVYSAATEREAK